MWSFKIGKGKDDQNQISVCLGMGKITKEKILVTKK
jgi:hypothetical protein